MRMFSKIQCFKSSKAFDATYSTPHSLTKQPELIVSYETESRDTDTAKSSSDFQKDEKDDKMGNERANFSTANGAS